METTVFDIEADSLKANRIHCLSHNNGETIYSYGDMRAFLSTPRVYVGHNIIRYDIPTLERLLGIKMVGTFVDTLALSWYLYPDRVRHGLSEWGEDLGVPKPKIEDWENLTREEYAYRCEQDVRINSLLWDRIWKDLVRLYGSESEARRLVAYLTFKMQCVALQEAHRWKLDVDRCTKGLEQLDYEANEKVFELSKAMPRKTTKVKSKPKKPFKMDGSHSVIGAEWFSLLKERGLPEDYDGEVEVEWEDGNPNSVDQLKSWLFSLGWEPGTYKYVRNKETNEFRKIPQVNNKEEGGVCASVKLLYKKEPKLKLLEGLSILQHRIGILKGFLSNVDEDGYVQACVQGLTNTLRFKHKVVVNLPGVDKPYGELIRGCLIAPGGYELCGSDMSGLEDRTKQHYMWDYDPDYVKEMNVKGFDPHLDIGVEAKMLEKEQVDFYKWAKKHEDEMDVEQKKLYKTLGVIRHDAKQVNYSCTYGVTPAGLVRNTGMSLPKAETLHKTYWKRNWSIKAISDDCVTKTFNKGKWLFNPVSKLWYSLRSEKDRFSTLNQGTGVYCFDTWVREVMKDGPPIIGQMHDEIICLIKLGRRDKCTKHIKDAMERTNQKLKLNRELDCDVQYGENYACIH